MKFYYIVTYLTVAGHITGIQGKTYPYLGCFSENSTNPILGQDKKVFTRTTLTLDSCVSHCIQGGWPYAGLQEGKYCYCGLSYGQYGRPGASGCTYTCDQDTLYCGGVNANSVYYAVNMDFTSVAWRAYNLHDTEAKNYGSARRVCVAQDGDLASVTSQAEFDNLLNTYNTETTTQHSVQNRQWAWIGLRYINYLQSYEWVDETTAYNITDVSHFWKPEPQTPGCVAIDFVTKQWFTLPCRTKLSFVCHQNISGIPPPEKPVQSKSAMFYIAIVFGAPLFFICYIGSCTSYIIYKIVKMWRKMKRQDAIKVDQEQCLMVQENFDYLEPSSESEPVITESEQYTFDNSSKPTETLYTPPGTPIREPPKLIVSPLTKSSSNISHNSLLVESRKLAHERRARDEEVSIASPLIGRHHIKPRQHREKCLADERQSVCSSSGSTRSVISSNQIEVKDISPKVKLQEAFRSKVFSAKNGQDDTLADSNDGAIQMSISDIIHVKRMVKGIKNKKGRGIISS